MWYFLCPSLQLIEIQLYLFEIAHLVFEIGLLLFEILPWLTNGNVCASFSDIERCFDIVISGILFRSGQLQLQTLEANLS